MISLDLRKDVQDLREMLSEAVRSYKTLSGASETAESYPPVTGIDLVFSLGDGESTPWVHLHLDTKPGSEPDGDPTHPDFGKLPREGWLPAFRAVCDGEEVAVTESNRNPRIYGDAGLSNAIGEFLVSTLLIAREDGLFNDLPRADRCELGVEDPTTGEFGWPRYEERGQENLL